MLPSLILVYGGVFWFVGVLEYGIWDGGFWMD